MEKEDALQEQLGVPVITLKAGSKGVFDDSFMGSMRLLGQIFGNGEKTEELIAYIGGRAAEISARTADLEEADKPGVYICGLGNWGTTNHLMTAQNYVSLTIPNVRNVVTDLASPGIQPIEEETFVALGREMDIMILDAAAVKNIKPLYQEDKTMFDSCKAWQTGEVYLEMAYNAFPHFPYPKRLIKTLAAALKENGRLTVAHSASRAAIDDHHKGAASKVSNGLMCADDLKKIFDKYFDVEIMISNSRMYQVSGVSGTRWSTPTAAPPTPTAV